MNGIPSPPVGVWYLGPIPLRAYAIAILAGIVIGAWIANKRYRERGGPEGALIDAVMWAVPFGIIGARIYHVLSSPDRYFGPDGNLALALRIWEGGLGIWGAIPAGALGAWISLRRSGLRFSPLADSIAPALLVAQAIGRLGNYFNQELFGAPTTLPWGLQIDQAHLRAQGLDYPEGTLFHPTFLYELLWCLAMAAVLIYVDRRFTLRHGRVLWLYVALYTVGRLWIELLRIDEAEHVLGLRLNVWTSIIVLLVAVAVFVIVGRRTRGVEDPIWIPGREPQEQVEEDEADPVEADPTDDEESAEPDDPLEDADTQAGPDDVDDDASVSRPDTRPAD